MLGPESAFLMSHRRTTTTDAAASRLYPTVEDLESTRPGSLSPGDPGRSPTSGPDGPRSGRSRLPPDVVNVFLHAGNRE
jgi:hypothetical protein